MVSGIAALYAHRDLVGALAGKSLAVRYKQAYLGVAWAVIRPVTMMLIFTVVRTFLGVDSGTVPYPVLTFAALLVWIFFQESTADGVNSVVKNTALVKKIYFPRAIFPLTAVITQLVDLGIGVSILLALMLWYRISPSVHLLWVPLIIGYLVVTSLTVALAGAAVNVYLRDVGQALPILLGLMMYLSPVLYPLDLVKQKLLVHHVAGPASEALYRLYTANPLAGIIDAFQNAVLRHAPPDVDALMPGVVLVTALLPVSYAIFRRAEADFADVI